MNQKKYLYSGPNSSATIKVSGPTGAFVDREVILWKGQVVELPAEHAFTAALISEGMLAAASDGPGRAADKAASTTGSGRSKQTSAE